MSGIYLTRNAHIIDSMASNKASLPRLGDSGAKEKIMMSKKLKAKILSLWKKGRNIWEISQLTGATEKDVMDVVQGRE